MQLRRKRRLTPPVIVPSGDPDEEEVLSVYSIEDSSVSPPVASPVSKSRRSSKRNKTVEPHSGSAAKRQQSKQTEPQSLRQTTNGRKGDDTQTQIETALTISDDTSSKPDISVDGDDDDDLLLEDVEMPLAEQADVRPTAFQDSGDGETAEENVELEDVEFEPGEVSNTPKLDEDHEGMYTAAYEAAHQDATTVSEEQPIIFKDGKGQPGALSISLSGPSNSPSVLRSAKKSTRVVTTRDRQIRLATHKWAVLSMIAHARWRNELINDDALRDVLYAMVPNAFLEKLRLIHPKKVPMQSERVRQFEMFLKDLTRWWSHKFQLDPVMTTCEALRQPDTDMLAGNFPRPGRRVDGWVVESAHQRQDRHRRERKREATDKGKEASRANGRAAARATTSRIRTKSKRDVDAVAYDMLESDSKPTHPLSEITLFGIGDSTTPVYLRLADVAEVIKSTEDLKSRVHTMAGSREICAQLFAALCRALGIPARLVISIQAPSWSVGAAKVAATAGAVDTNAKKGGDLAKRKKEHAAEAKRKGRLQQVYKPLDVLTSDDESFTATASDSHDESALTASQSRTRLASQSASSKAGSSANSPKPTKRALVKTPQRGRSSGAYAKDMTPTSAERAEGKGKHREKGDGDYRSEKWHGLDAPLDVKYEPKLRLVKPKPLKDSEVAGAEPDIDPVDLASPPTMWVEVFSKPWQKWITVDPVRGMVEPLSNRQMEPSPSDKHNRLVYVLAFEEDGFARDVTARYTRTLHSRVSRMRPPPSARKNVGAETLDWWSRVVAAVHRPQRLDRDAAEDIELEAAASREPMPSSAAAFKDHPVYTLEKHLKRDEVIFPAKQAGTFQGTPVFLRSSVLTCRSARQWYNEGRTVRVGEEALKWVKSRGYTLANKRAEEEARQQGVDGLQEGLYALFQTELYRAPAVVDGRVPTNSFGNIDLFVDTMLPPGGAHVPYNGAGKVAKQLGVHYAEAIVGFEFRKHRSMPKLKGIVVPEEHADAVTEAYWASEHMQAEREMIRKRDRLFKNWKKLLNAIKIQERVQREYGGLVESASENDDGEGMDPAAVDDQVEEEDLDGYRRSVDQPSKASQQPAGGFVVE